MKRLFSILIVLLLFIPFCLAEPADISEISIIKSGGKAGELYSLKMYLADDKAIVEKSELEYEGANESESSYVLEKEAFLNAVDFINSNDIRKFASMEMDPLLREHEISTTSIILKFEGGMSEKINELQIPLSEDFRGFHGLKPFIEKQIEEKQLKDYAVHNGKPVKIDEGKKSPDGKGYLIVSDKPWYADMVGDYAMFEEDLYLDEAILDIAVEPSDDKQEIAKLNISSEGRLTLSVKDKQISAELPKEIYTNSPLAFSAGGGERLEIKQINASHVNVRFLLKIQAGGKTSQLVFNRLK